MSSHPCRDYQRSNLVILFIVLMLGNVLSGCDSRPDAGGKQRENNALAGRELDSLFEAATAIQETSPDSASATFEKAVALASDLHLADRQTVKACMVIAENYIKAFQYSAASKYLEKAQLIADTVRIEPQLKVDLYYLMANCKENLADYQGARSLLEAGVRLVEDQFPEDSLRLQRGLFLLAGNSYYENHFVEARDYLLRSMRYISKGDHQRARVAYTTLGMIAIKAGNARGALPFFYKAVQQATASSNPDNLARVFIQMSDAFRVLKMYDSARFYLIKNLRLREAVYGDKNPATFGAKQTLGEFYLEIGEPDSALHYFHGGLRSLINDFDLSDYAKNPAPRIIECNTDLISALIGKADAAYEKSLRSSDNQALRSLALKAYLLADSVQAVYQNNFVYDDTHLSFLDAEQIQYDKIIRLAMERTNRADGEVDFDLILGAMEQTRATLLQNSLIRAKQFSSIGIDPRYLANERKLRAERTQILQRLAQDEGGRSSDSLNSRLLRLEIRLVSLQQQIANEYPNYQPDAHPLQKNLIPAVRDYVRQHDAAMIEYYATEEKLYALLISPDDISAFSMDRDDYFNTTLTNFLSLVSTGGDTYRTESFRAFTRSAAELYHILIEPFANHLQTVDRLIISGNGVLAMLPFDALITQPVDDSVVDYRLPYLGNEKVISYAYSSNVLVQQQKHRNGNAVLAMAYGGNRQSAATRGGRVSLPGSEKELEGIRSVMPGRSSQYLVSDEATESAFKKRSPKFNIVHLALHGESDSLNALNSRIIFPEDTADEDGYLYAHELYDLDLESLDLAVLTSCETGLGKQQKGEGVMSIARGFAYAGCPSIVLSLWRIDDLSAANLITEFYRQLAGGHSVDDALSAAKREYVRTANEFNSHPSYWAAFVVVGNTSPIGSGRHLSNYIAILLAVVGSAFLGWLYYSKRINKEQEARASE